MIVHKSGALPPIENVQKVEEQLLLSRRYQNNLVEVARARFGAARAEVDAHPSVVVEKAALERRRAELPPCATPKDCDDGDLCATCEALVPAIKRVGEARGAIWATVRDARRVVEADPAVQAALAAAVVASKGHARAQKTKVARVREEVARGLAAHPSASFGARLLAVTNEINARARAYTALLRERSGLSYGTYLLVEAAVKAAQKSGNEPHFTRYDGSGRIGVQIQKTASLTCAGAFDGADTRLRIVRRPDPPAVAPGSSRSGRRAVAILRIGSDGRAPVWAAWPVILHRPLPPNGQIKWAWMQRRKVGPDFRWEFCVTVDGGTNPRDRAAGTWTCDGIARGSCGTQHRSREAALRHCENDARHIKRVHGPDAVFDRSPVERIPSDPITCDGNVAVDLGWRVRGDGLRAGYWRDEHGHGGEFLLPQAIRDKLDHARSIGAIRRRAFDAFLPQFAEMIDTDVVAALPERLRREVESVRMWKSPDRLARFFQAWRDFDPRGTSRAWISLSDWARQDVHLHKWEAHETAKALARRNDQYRVWSAWLARRYQHGTALIEQFDQTKVAGRRGVSKRASKAEKVRADRASSVRHVVAAGKFKLALLNACRSRGVIVKAVKAAWTTIDCATCTKRLPWDPAPQVKHRCDSCGTTWDQDEQACVNMLKRHASGEVERNEPDPLAGHGIVRQSKPRRRSVTAPAVVG